MPIPPPTPSTTEPVEPQAPRVTVLVVSYNSVAALRQCVGAIAVNAEVELLVVDLGSTDGSAQIDAEFPNVTALRLPKHFGATKAMNIATRTAAADYILYLDPHAVLNAGVPLALAAILDADPSISAVAPLLEDEAGKPCPQVYRLPDAAALAAACESGQLPVAPIDPKSGVLVPVEYASRTALMVRKDFIRGMNYFDERYGHAWGDLELAWQIQNAQRKTVVATALRGTLQNSEQTYATGSTTVADRYNGAAGYLAKHNGFGAGLSFRVSAIFRALFGFQFGLLMALVTDQKIDGTQSSL